MQNIGGNDFVISRWISKKSNYARNKNNSLSIDETSVYSYGNYTIATFVNNGKDNDIIFFDNVNRSITTTAHKKVISQALAYHNEYANNKLLSGYPVFFLPINRFEKPYSARGAEIMEKYYIPAISSCALLAKSAKNKRANHIESIERLMQEAKEFCKYFSLDIPIRAVGQVTLEEIDLMRIANILEGKKIEDCWISKCDTMHHPYVRLPAIYVDDRLI